MIYPTRTHSHQDSLAKIENKNPYIFNACKPLIYWDLGKSFKKVKFFRTFFEHAASYLMTFVSLFQFSLFLKKRERRRDAAFLFGQISVIPFEKDLCITAKHTLKLKYGV